MLGFLQLFFTKLQYKVKEMHSNMVSIVFSSQCNNKFYKLNGSKLVDYMRDLVGTKNIPIISAI